MPFLNFFKKHGIFILGALLMILWRIPSLFDPLWYGDEAYYAAIGQSVARGDLLYVDIWDNKPPFLYLVYAVSNLLFGSELWPLRVLNLICALASIFLIYLLAGKVFELKDWRNKVAFGVAVLLFTFGWETTIFNAENLFVPLILGGFYFIYRHLDFFKVEARKYILSDNVTLQTPSALRAPSSRKDKRNLIIGSIFWALACFTKSLAAVEVLGLLFLLIIIWKSLDFKLIEIAKKVALVLGILSVPYLISAILFLIKGHFWDFIYAILLSGESYVGAFAAKPVFLGAELPISGLQWRTLLLFLSLGIIAYLHLQKRITRRLFLLLGWSFVTAFAMFVSERSYPHYLIQMFAPITILIAIAFDWLAKVEIKIEQKILYCSTILLCLHLILFSFGGGKKIPHYFNFKDYWLGFAEVTLGQKDLATWQANYNQENFEQTKVLVPIIQNLTGRNERIFLAANMPHIYAQSERLPSYKFPVDYQYEQKDVPEIYQSLVQKSTKLIILDKKSERSTPFGNFLSKDYNLAQTVVDRYEIWVKK